jgi:hypothetical protein
MGLINRKVTHLLRQVFPCIGRKDKEATIHAPGDEQSLSKCSTKLGWDD